jgi:predicted MFS family arabinose efflux permease
VTQLAVRPTSTIVATARGLSPRASFALLGSIVVVFLAASSAPTPLYALYQSEWGFTATTTTIVFGTYAIAVLVSLLVLGRLSDHVGRRPVLLAAIAVQAVAMVLFATADGVPMLLVARAVQGLSTGAAVAAIGAGMLDIDRVRGTLANAAVPAMGTAVGALVASFVVALLPAPTHLIFLALLGVLALQAVGVLLMLETVTPEPGAVASMRPTVALPRSVRGPAAVALPVLFAVWALPGFYGSLGPALVATLVGSSSALFAGLGLFVLAGTASVTVVVLRHRPARDVLLVGIAALVVGIAVVLVAISVLSPVLFFVGTAIAGIGFGSGFQGAIRLVVPQTLPHERAGVLSLMYVVSYLGMGVPAVIAGVAVVHDGGLLVTAQGYGIAVVALALVALAGLLRRTVDRPV